MWKQKRMYGKRLGRYSSWQHLRYSPSPETPALTDPIPATSNLPINSDIYIYISVDSFVPRIPVSLRKISAVKMTNFIMPSIPHRILSIPFRSLFPLFSCYFRSSIFRESFSRYYFSQISEFKFPTVLRVFRKI